MTDDSRRVVAEVMLPVAIMTFVRITEALAEEFPTAMVEPRGDRYRIWSKPA